MDYKTIITNDIISWIDGDNIEGLYLDSTYSIKYNNEKIKEDITLYIKMKEVKVTFKYEDKEEIIYIKRSSIITYDLITILKEEDIEGLYIDSTYTTKYNNEEIKEDITLYIKIKEVKVTFKYEDKEEIVNINKSSIITYDSITILKEEDIEGLYIDSTYTTKYNNEEIKEDVTIYIKIKEVKVTFKYKDKEEEIILKKNTIIDNNMITLMDTIFIEGLYLAESYTMKYNNEEIKEDITLYIKIKEGLVEKEDKDFIWHFDQFPKNSTGMSIGGPLFYFTFKNENIVFECTTTGGSFIHNKGVTSYRYEYQNHFDAHVTIFQCPSEAPIYLDTIIWENDKIVGYIVFEFSDADEKMFNITLLKSIEFPKLFGEYQNVSEEQVKELIKLAKNK